MALAITATTTTVDAKAFPGKRLDLGAQLDWTFGGWAPIGTAQIAPPAHRFVRPHSRPTAAAPPTTTTTTTVAPPLAAAPSGVVATQFAVPPLAQPPRRRPAVAPRVQPKPLRLAQRDVYTVSSKHGRHYTLFASQVYDFNRYLLYM